MPLIALIGLAVLLFILRQRWKYAQEARQALDEANELFVEVKNLLNSLETAHNLLRPEQRTTGRLSDETLSTVWREFRETSRAHKSMAADDAEHLGIWVSVADLKERRDKYLDISCSFEEIQQRIFRIQGLIREIDELIEQFPSTEKEVKEALAALNIYLGGDHKEDFFKAEAADPVYTLLLQLEQLMGKQDNLRDLTRMIQQKHQTVETLTEIRDNYLKLLQRYAELDIGIAECSQLARQISSSDA